MNDDLVYRLRERARIRRQIPTRKSVLEGKSDRIADLLEEAANEIEKWTNIYSSTETPTLPNTHGMNLDDFLNKMRTDAGWVDVNELQWGSILRLTDGIKPEPDVGGNSLHCYNNVFKIGNMLYDITYDYIDQCPIWIKAKEIK